MSTWMSTWSGITFVFVPPWITVGANVVCVHEYTTRDRPSGSVPAKSRSSSSFRRASRNSGGYCMPSTNPRHVSPIRVGGRYSCRRRTTSAAVTTALSVRNGCDACPGVPRTVSFDQYVPFSSTITGRRAPTDVGIWKPPDSVRT